jgi:hypothetical protein
LKIPLPSPNVMVPKQSFETRRPVLPSVAYSMASCFLASPKSARPRRGGAGRRPLRLGPRKRCFSCCIPGLGEDGSGRNRTISGRYPGLTAFSLRVVNCSRILLLQPRRPGRHGSHDRPTGSAYRDRHRRCRPPPPERAWRQAREIPAVSVATALCSSSRKSLQRV